MPESMFTPAYRLVIDAVVAMRREAGLTQRDLADRLGREQSFIGRIETGQRRVDLVEFAWICSACGVDADEKVREVLRSMRPLLGSRRRRR